MATASMAAPSTSRLLLLPAELRSYICTLALQSNFVVEARPTMIIDLRHRKRNPVTPRLLRVNRQLRNECLSIYYRIHTFTVLLWCSKARWKAVSWLNMNPAAGHYVRHLHVWPHKVEHVLSLKRKRATAGWKLWESKQSRGTELIKDPHAWWKENLLAHELEVWKVILCLLGGELAAQ